MGTISNPAITNNVRAGSHDATWASVYSFINTPQHYPELVERYGKAFQVFDFYRMAGREGTIASQTMTAFEKGAPERYVTLHTATGTVAAGVAFAMELEEWDTVANGGRPAVAVNDKIYLPAAYCTVDGVKCTVPQAVQVTAIATVTANPNEEDTDITVKALNKLTTVAITIPAGTKLMVTGGNYAAGSQGANSKTSGWYYRTFTTAIKREALAIEGSTQSTERYVDKLIGGGYGVFSDASIESEFRLDQSMNYEMLLGDTVDNLTMVNRDGVANTARGTKGIMPHLYESGCKQYYTTSYTIPDIDNIKKAFISQGVSDTNAAFFVGSELNRGIENNALDFVKEYSGGSDFLTNLKNLQVGFKTITKNSITLSLHELSNFSNPNTLGNYNFDKYGFIIPNTQVTVRDTEMSAEAKVANLRIMYKSYNGEDRKRIVKPIPGVSGLSNAPNFAVDSWDDFRLEWLTEFALAYLKVNQSILVMDDSVL